MSEEMEMTAAQVLAALGGAIPAPPACDYYGREIMEGDSLRVSPWATFGVPNSCIGVPLAVVGQTADGNVVVSDGGGVVAALPQEMVVIADRDGSPLSVESHDWWANLIASPRTAGTLSVHLEPLPVGADSRNGVPS